MSGPVETDADGTAPSATVGKFFSFFSPDLHHNAIDYYMTECLNAIDYFDLMPSSLFPLKLNCGWAWLGLFPFKHFVYGWIVNLWLFGVCLCTRCFHG
jgi:hypothetical protein